MSFLFSKQEFVFVEPDGRKSSLIGSGDQNYAEFHTPDGYTVVRDPNTGFYVYARLSPQRDRLVPTGARPGDVDPKQLGLVPGLRIDEDIALALAERQRRALQGGCSWQRRARDQLQANLVQTFAAKAAPLLTPVTGSFVGLCLLVRFPDRPSELTRAQVQDFCNQPGYSEFGNNGSVRDYFLENSGGRLRYTNVVTDYYDALHPFKHYDDPQRVFGEGASELIREALQHWKDQGFDFSALSADSQGHIHAVNVFYAGPKASTFQKGLWPHQGSIFGGFRVDANHQAVDYQISDMSDELTLGTFCHENGHLICNYHDLYHVGGLSTRGVGRYCLMCVGGRDTPTNPARICGYHRMKSGWADQVTMLTVGDTVTLSARSNQFAVVRKSPTEYYVIENRERDGRDESIGGSGLAVWHVDETGSNNNQQRTPARHYECALIQADGQFDLENNRNQGDGGDLFSEDTSATARLVWWDGTDSGVYLDQISASGNSMTFTVAHA